MTSDNSIYKKLAEHLSKLGMGYPIKDELIDILKAMFTEIEAEAALAIPTMVGPLQPAGMDDIRGRVNMPEDEVLAVLESLEKRGLLYSGKTEAGKKGYALHQFGYGFPQIYFWKGEGAPEARKMAKLTAKYFNREVIRNGFSSTTETKPSRYIPVNGTIATGKQAVYSHHMMGNVIDEARMIALAHCGCRVVYKMMGRDCPHPTEVCMKFNDMAQYLIDHELGREITKAEAHDVIRQSEEAGLVHFVDNAEGDIQHNCNCCGCACWNVGNIKRKKIPRDMLMATYFIRETDQEVCIGCGACVERCPVEAVKMDGAFPDVDEAWCIGCGVCAKTCPSEAIKMVKRPDKPLDLPAKDFRALHGKILKEKGLERRDP